MGKFEETELHNVLKPFIELRFEIYKYVEEILGIGRLDLELNVVVNNRTVELHFTDLILTVSDDPSIKFKDPDKHFHFNEFVLYKRLSDKILRYNPNTEPVKKT